MRIKKISLLFTIIITVMMVVPVAKAEKVLVVGIDGGTFNLIKPWAEEGKLPNLAKLMNEGAHGNLSSMLPYISPVMWPSFYTGKNPGKHGLFEFLRREPSSYKMIPVLSTDVKSKAIWDLVNKDGKKVILINVPITFPPRKVDGIMITGFLSLEDSIFTYPPELTKELNERGYKIEALRKRFTPGDEDELLKALNETLEKRSEVALEFIGNEEWELFIVVFTGSDRIQHYFWRYMDTNDKKYGDAILEYYEKLDQEIGKMLEKIDDDTYVVVMSDHGFGPLKGEVYINWWLTEKGYLKYKSPLTYWTIKLGFTQQTIATFLKKIGLFKLFDSFANKTGINFQSSVPYPTYESVDFSKTKAYAAQFGGGIYINLKGREPQGVVEHAEYEKLRDEIIKELENLKNPKTEEKFFPKVYKKEELYSGPYINHAPDIVIDTEAYDPVGWFGYNKIYDDSPVKSGSHRKNGILIIWGKDVQHVSIEDAKITDVAPTILKLMSVEIPEDMDGSPLI